MKIRLYICSLLVVASLCAYGQGDSKAKPKKTGNEWHAAGDAPLRSKEFADRLTKELGLDAATSKQLYNTYLANTKAVDEIKFGQGSDADKMAALKENASIFDLKIKGILTPAQFEKYLKSGAAGSSG